MSEYKILLRSAVFKKKKSKEKHTASPISKPLSLGLGDHFIYFIKGGKLRKGYFLEKRTQGLFN